MVSHVQTMSDLRISILMATYNGEKYIREQLNSLARQTLLPFELVVTDDRSTDSTLDILKAYSGSAPFPVRVFRNATRLGYEENFLKAASLCNGDVIAFCDQDDIWMERKLEVCSRYFADQSIVGVFHTGQVMADSGELGQFQQFHPYFPKTKVVNPGDLDLQMAAPGFSVIIRRELVDLADSRGRHEFVKSHDRWFCFLATNAGRTATLSDVLVWYRRHDRNTSPPPRRQGLLAAIRGYAGAHDYTFEADSELNCALILEQAAERRPERAPVLRRCARKLRYRSRLRRIRTEMYHPKSALFLRAAKFVHIVLLGGYFPDRSGARLGFTRGVKDLLWGVSGAYKLFMQPSRMSAQAVPEKR